MASGLVPGQPPHPLIPNCGGPKARGGEGLSGTLACGGIGPDSEGRGKSVQAFPGDSVCTGELGGTAQLEQTVPVGDQQAAGLRR